VGYGVTAERDLHAAVPGIRVSQPRSTGRRRVYNGIGLQENRFPGNKGVYPKQRGRRRLAQQF
jgi:hypothetical protein